MAKTTISDPIDLPCGVKLHNRLAKAPLTEGLADEYGRATQELCTLYQRWREESKMGLLVTGNVQIDRRYLERPGNVCIDGPQDEKSMQLLKDWAKACQSSTTTCWVQLNHPGRQANADVAVASPAPSALPVQNKAVPVAPPYEMSLEQLKRYQTKYAEAARVCKEAGFGGVQLHSAHGYLMSAFLNPSANQRTDDYGGSLENRARFLLETVALVREAVGPGYPIGVKLNSSDFQKVGFTHEDSVRVAQWLDEAGIDLLDISGGNYENFDIFGGENTVVNMANKKESTIQREAYFLKYAKDISQVMKKTPLMVTGGFRSRSVMEEALNGQCEMIGIGRPILSDPSSTGQMLDGKLDKLPQWEHDYELPWYVSKTLDAVATQYIKGMVRMAMTNMGYFDAMIRMGEGQDPDESANMFLRLIAIGMREANMAKALKGLPQDDPTLRQNVKSKVSAAAMAGVSLVAVAVALKINR